ncbi:MAG TPA: hypothetical protein VEA61_11145 [Allosphingosinicella sp.]|nr:hypothetical protein [Allosphingosinicella sp.]
MTEPVDEDIKDVSDADMKEFCAAIGELILWASLIDGQLNRALVGMMALPHHVMIEPIVAQLDPRPKAELLKKRAKIITSTDWRNKIRNWVERAEKVNAKRNIVAHHGIRVADGKIMLHSDQLGKIIDSLDTTGDTIKVGESRSLADIKEWIEQAKVAFEEGQNVVANLGRFREAALAKLDASKA